MYDNPGLNIQIHSGLLRVVEVNGFLESVTEGTRTERNGSW
jgi:hypothetical protein